MARIRIRIKLNEGGEGAPLSQLVSVAKEAEIFLRYLAQDIGIELPKSSWLARNFENSSVAFDTESEISTPLDKVREFNAGFNYVAQFDPEKQRVNGHVKQRTLLQFAKIADALGPHEKMGFGLYHESEEKPYTWKPLYKRDALKLKEALTEEITYKGSIQGKADALFSGSLHFRIKLPKSEDIVSCYFEPSLYEAVAKAFQKRLAHIYVLGTVTARRVDRHIIQIQAHDIKVAPYFSDADYRNFFAAAPDYPGGVLDSDTPDETVTHDD